MASLIVSLSMLVFPTMAASPAPAAGPVLLDEDLATAQHDRLVPVAESISYDPSDCSGDKSLDLRMLMVQLVQDDLTKYYRDAARHTLTLFHSFNNGDHVIEAIRIRMDAAEQKMMSVEGHFRSHQKHASITCPIQADLNVNQKIQKDQQRVDDESGANAVHGRQIYDIERSVYYESLSQQARELSENDDHCSGSDSVRLLEQMLSIFNGDNEVYFDDATNTFSVIQRLDMPVAKRVNIYTVHVDASKSNIDRLEIKSTDFAVNASGIFYFDLPKKYYSGNPIAQQSRICDVKSHFYPAPAQQMSGGSALTRTGAFN